MNHYCDAVNFASNTHKSIQQRSNTSALAMELRIFCLELYNSLVKVTYGVSTVVPGVLLPYRVILEHILTRPLILLLLKYSIKR